MDPSNRSDLVINALAREARTYERALNEIGKLALTISDHDTLVRAIGAILRSVLPPAEEWNEQSTAE